MVWVWVVRNNCFWLEPWLMLSSTLALWPVSVTCLPGAPFERDVQALASWSADTGCLLAFRAVGTQSCRQDRARVSTRAPGDHPVCLLPQVNESWTLENCTVAKCQGNNQIILLEPEPVDNVTCVNKHLPIKVWDQEPCHFHYECECEQRASMGQLSKMGQHGGI